MINSLKYINCSFSFSRSLSLLSSIEIGVYDIEIKNSVMSENDLIYISQSKDLTFDNMKIINVTKNSTSNI